jgi:hypothetical protein
MLNFAVSNMQFLMRSLVALKRLLLYGILDFSFLNVTLMKSVGTFQPVRFIRTNVSLLN